jgi:hypothetical protein
VVRRSARSADLTVFRIDDRDTRGYEWHVAPGPHRMWIELVQYGTAMNVRFKGWMYCAIDFEAVAGDTYQVISESAQRVRGGDTDVSLGLRVVDGSGASVGIADGCSGRRPRFR